MPYTNTTCTHPDHPVGMAYVPWQAFGEPFSPEMALVHGTLFPDLSLPFFCANPACANRPRNMGGQPILRGGRR